MDIDANGQGIVKTLLQLVALLFLLGCGITETS